MLDITAHCLEEVRFFGRNFAKAAFVPSVVLDHHPQARRPAVHRFKLVIMGESLAHCLHYFTNSNTVAFHIRHHLVQMKKMKEYN